MKKNNELIAIKDTLFSGSRRMGLVSSLSILCLCGTMQTASATEEKHGEIVEQHGAHEHGTARMTLAVSDTGLDVSLESPAANLFGFEHNASTDEDHSVVHKAVKTLKAEGNVLTIDSSAGCKLAEVKIESSIVAAHKAEKHGDDEHKEEGEHDDKDDHDKHKEEGKHGDKDDHDKHKEDGEHDDKDDHDKHKEDGKHGDKDDHDKHKEGDKHDEHEKGEKHKDHDESAHSDVDASWTFTCKHPEKIEAVNIGLFTAFPSGFEKLSIEWLTQEKTGAVQLKKDQRVSFVE